MTSPANIISQIAVVYFDDGNDAFTKNDSASLLGSDAIYSLVDDQPVSINEKNTFSQNDIASLGTNHFENGNYQIGLNDQKDGIFASGQNIYLKGKQTGLITNLSAGNYTFSTNAGKTTGRFEIIYKPENTLVTNDLSCNKLEVYRKEDNFVLSSPGQMISAVEVYDTYGRMLYKMSAGKTEVTILAEHLTRGVLVLQVNLQNGETVSRKIRY